MYLYGETNEERKQYIRPLLLTPVNLQETKVVTFIGAGLFVAFVVMLILSFRKDKEKVV